MRLRGRMVDHDQPRRHRQIEREALRRDQQAACNQARSTVTCNEADAWVATCNHHHHTQAKQHCPAQRLNL